MPLLNGQEVSLQLSPPASAKEDGEAWVVRWTGEIYTDYDSYIARVHFLRRHAFTCAQTGQSDLTYEAALTSERGARAAAAAIPEALQAAIVRAAHLSTIPTDRLPTALLNAFHCRFLPGEPVRGAKESGQTDAEVVGAKQLFGGPLPDNLAHLTSVVQALAAGQDPPNTPELAAGADFDLYDVRLPDGTQEPLPAQSLQRPVVLSEPAVRAIVRGNGSERLGKVARAAGGDAAEVPHVYAASADACAKFGLPAPPAGIELVDPPAPAADTALDAAAGGFDLDALMGEVEWKETLEQTERRLPENTTKWYCFQVLRDAGAAGLSLKEMVQQLDRRGLKRWDGGERTAKNTITFACSNDPAFAKVGVGRWALMAFPGVKPMAPSKAINKSLVTKGRQEIAEIEKQEKEIRAQIEQATSEAARAPGSARGAQAANDTTCRACGNGPVEAADGAEAQPLLCCDECSAAYHLGCVDPPIADPSALPSGGWRCPDCAGRVAALTAKLAELQERKKAIQEKAKTIMDKASQQMSMRGIDLERRRRDKELRDMMRAEAKRMARYPIDDAAAVEELRQELERAQQAADARQGDVARAAGGGAAAGAPGAARAGTGARRRAHRSRRSRRATRRRRRAPR
ncbi:unnamed protein product [Pedinophyceae sp. YPF-701]|nr:unnamed protein product [Pedinophyceae sp. YPF-701]